MRTRTRWRFWSLGGVALAVSLVGLIGVAHTPWGRPLLAFLPGMSGGCPIGAEIDPQTLATVRSSVTESLRGQSPTRSRRVLTFELGVSTRADVEAWADARALDCTAVRPHRWSCDGHTLPGAIPGTVQFGFDAEQRLVDVERSTRTDDVVLAVHVAQALSEELTEHAGPPTRIRGATDSAHLARAPLRQQVHEYRYADMRARVTATNVGSRGYSVRSIYQAL